MRKRSMQALVLTVAGVMCTYGVSYGQALTPCTSNCAAVGVAGGTVAVGETLDLPITFNQAPNDNQANQGNDDVAAIAMTVGLGPVGSPLQLADCADANSDGLPDGIVPGESVADDFRVVVENAFCTNRNRCLCPDGTQTRDNFVNLVVYGPRDLPPQGPVNIPRIPNADPLVTIRVRPAASSASPIPIVIFAETEDDAKPQFGAFLSIGDQSAIDQTADRGTNVSKVTVEAAQVTVEPGTGGCEGDCNNSGFVEINELVVGVNILLETSPLSACPSFDFNNSQAVEVNELVRGVNNALNDCAL